MFASTRLCRGPVSNMGELKHRVGKYNPAKRERFWKKYESSNEMQQDRMLKNRRLSEKAGGEGDFWDIVPSEFRSESLMLQATGSGFNSMFEDRNVRTAAIQEELSNERFKPPFDTRLKTNAHERSIQDLYPQVPELKLMKKFSINRTHPGKRARSAPPTQSSSSMLHPHVMAKSQMPFPMGAKKRDPFPQSAYNPKKDPKYETRIS